jgi:[ribosomal protein S18]-alanine N-acetyltransferase
MLTLIEAGSDDVASLAGLERELFQYDVISPRQMRYLIKSDTAIVVKAELDSSTVGSMILLRRSNSKVLRIYSIGVIETIRNTGIGHNLLHYAENRLVEFGCNRMHLEVNVHNTKGLIFFLSSGFFLYGRKNNYYTDGAMALLLRKEIDCGDPQ